MTMTRMDKRKPRNSSSWRHDSNTSTLSSVWMQVTLLQILIHKGHQPTLTGSVFLQQALTTRFRHQKG